MFMRVLAVCNKRHESRGLCVPRAHRPHLWLLESALLHTRFSLTDGQQPRPLPHPLMASIAAVGVEAGERRGEQPVGQVLYAHMPRAPRTDGETRAASSMARADAGAAEY